MPDKKAAQQPPAREHWGSRIGLILAMAGNAVGLGNFLRFPTQAASNGGGAFMIPYFIALIFLGIPLMWVEWGIGRFGGALGHGTMPGTFHKIVKNRWAKYLGVFGLVLSFFIAVYYVFIESWTLSFAYFSATGRYAHLEGETYEARSKEMGRFLSEFQGIPPKVKLLRDTPRDDLAAVRSMTEATQVPASFVYDADRHGTWNPADPSLDQEKCPYTEVSLKAKYFPDFSLTYFFFLVASAANFYFLYRGLSAGIEQLGKIGMPILFGFAVVLAFRVLTFGTPAGSAWSVADGFNFLWTPDFSQLGRSAVWLAAAGQIFFTLSLGTGAIQTYASYLSKKDDIVLTGLATSALNEFAEVILGGTIAIPAAVAFFGKEATMGIARSGSFNLGFQALPMIFSQISLGGFFGFIWFGLLFIAGITSSVALLMPPIAFLKDELKISHQKAVLGIGLVYFILAHGPVLYLGQGVLDEMDYWAGTFLLVVFALLEIVVFIWILGPAASWKEMHYGADMKIPRVFQFIGKFITPTYIFAILLAWAFQNGWSTLIMDGVPIANRPYIWATRLVMMLVTGVFLHLIYYRFRDDDPEESPWVPAVLWIAPLLVHVAAYPGLLSIHTNALLFVVCSWIFVIGLASYCMNRLLNVPPKRHDDFPEELATEREER
ncbi:MAG: sodium:calcium symporter [Candidatus Riflebacteria bacterium]|nr:sodium:calcium symporter [Candidatus Riflebacteria bacterium]